MGSPSIDFFMAASPAVAHRRTGATLLVDGVGGIIVETGACNRDDPASHLREARGLMSGGVIDIANIRGRIEDQGFAGDSEVGIFSTGNWWQRTTDNRRNTGHLHRAAPQRGSRRDRG